MIDMISGLIANALLTYTPQPLADPAPVPIPCHNTASHG